MKHCLIVDNSAVIRKVARRILDGAGYYVSEASSGAEGWRLCRNTKPNVLLLDYILPYMGALEFIEALRRSNAAPLPHISALHPLSRRAAHYEGQARRRCGLCDEAIRQSAAAGRVRTPARPSESRVTT